MSRAIKFRAWDKDKGLMGYTRYNQEENIWEWLGVSWGDNLELMQFTGLLDKNGKEIYDGDIVRHGGSGTKLDEVYYETGRGQWMLRQNGTYNDELWYFCKEEVEVVGNIYENPDLLADK